METIIDPPAHKSVHGLKMENSETKPLSLVRTMGTRLVRDVANLIMISTTIDLTDHVIALSATQLHSLFER